MQVIEVGENLFDIIFAETSKLKGVGIGERHIGRGGNAHDQNENRRRNKAKLQEPKVFHAL